MAIRYGKVRCPKCSAWYGLDESHVCAAASIQLAALAAVVTEIPDWDRAHPAGLTWIEPLMPRPIALGPSANHPEVRPVLALDADRFWSGARHGLDIGRARVELDDAAVRYALSADLRRAPAEVAALAQAATAWDHAIHAYAKEEMTA